MLRSSTLFFFLTITAAHFLYGQADSTVRRKSTIIFEMEVENGGILQQKNAKAAYQDAYYEGVNYKIGWQQRNKEDPYFELYNNPIYGIGFYSSTFNNDIIGNPYALYGFVQTPIAPREHSRWSYDYRIGLGLSGNFYPFDEEDNPFNLVIGSKNNVFIDLGIRAQYAFHPKWRAGVGLAFHHFSNGALALPNSGVNLVPLTISVNYQPNPMPVLPRKADIPPYSRRILFHINYGAGVKQLSKDNDHRYFKSTLSAYASRHVSHKWRVGGGLDLFYSSSGNDNEIAGDKSGDLGSKLSGGPSFYLAHVLNQRLVLNGNVGYYVHNQVFNGEINKFFLRAGARYYVYENINAGVSIKAHMGKADFIEWTVGYTFNR